MTTQSNLIRTIAAAALALTIAACAPTEATGEATTETTETTEAKKPNPVAVTVAPTTTTTTTIDPINAQMQTWVEDNADMPGELAALFGEAADASGSGNVDDLIDVCVRLGERVGLAQRESLPVPLESIDTPLRAAFDAYLEGASLCTVGAATGDVDMISQAAELMSAGGGHMDAATTAMGAYSDTL